MSLVFSIFVPWGVTFSIVKCPLFLMILSSFSIANNVITLSTCCRTSEMYNPYTLQAVTASSRDSLDFLFSSTEVSA